MRTPITLREEVDGIISLRGDDEKAHSKEDRLHLSLIREFCPSWVVEEVERLQQADFVRWRA